MPNIIPSATPDDTNPTALTPEREQEIRSRRLDEVTAGPWLVADAENGRPLIYVEREGNGGEVRALPLLVADAASEADVQFVASARRSVPELLAELDRVRAELAARPTRAEVLNEVADKIERKAKSMDATWLRADQVCDALRRLGDPAPADEQRTDGTPIGGDR